MNSSTRYRIAKLMPIIARSQQTITRLLMLIVSLWITTESVFAQGNVQDLFFYEFGTTAFTPDTTVYTVVEKQPEFPGGRQALENYLMATVRYPSEAKKAGVKGRVFTSFIVEPDGQITHVQLLRGLGYGCDEEAIRLVQNMPCWKPGGQSGRPLRVKYNLPILFGIDYPKVNVR